MSSLMQEYAFLIHDLICNSGGKIQKDFRMVENFHTFSLGIAQHYGLPSVGWILRIVWKPLYGLL